MSSFWTALSGLNAQATALDVVGNNLANLNTTGYKASEVAFKDLMGAATGNPYTSIGQGVYAPSSVRLFSQGGIQITSGGFDAAIQGDGFFMTKNSTGQTQLTRSGNLHLDASGNLVTLSGEKVQGWNAVGGAISASGATTGIVVPASGSSTPIPTTAISISANLNAAGTVGAADGSFSTSVEAVDSLGANHLVSVTFTKTGPNAWNYEATLPAADTGSTAGKPTSLVTGSMTFDASGALLTPAAPGTVAIPISGLADGADTMSVNWSLFGSDGKPTVTQFSQPSAASATSQNGSAASQLVKVTLGDGGMVVAQYSNGQSVNIAQIAIATVRNPDSLVSTGNNNYTLTSASSALTIGAADTGGRGKILAGSLENSTVDIAKEFTNLIVYQRGYQANSKVITTLDTLTQDLMSLKR